MIKLKCYWCGLDKWNTKSELLEHIVNKHTSQG